MNKISILGISSILACITLSGCANKAPSFIDGDFGVKLNQPAGDLTVTGYNDDYTLMTIKPSQPSSLFKDYSVNVNPETKQVSKINAISAVPSSQSCIQKKDEIFNYYKNKYNGQYRTIGTLNKDTQFIGFDNATIQFSCNGNVVVSYTPR